MCKVYLKAFGQCAKETTLNDKRAYYEVFKYVLYLQ